MLARAVLARLAQPGTPEHLTEFRQMEAVMHGDSSVAKLRQSRKDLDRPKFADTTEVSTAGASLIVDTRNLSALLQRLRWRAMDRVHELYAVYETQKKSKPEPEARAELLKATGEYVTFLSSDPIQDPESARNRYEHWNAGIAQEVLAVVQMRAVAYAMGQLTAEAGDSGKADVKMNVKDIPNAGWTGPGQPPTKEVSYTQRHAEALNKGGMLTTQDWCGAFAVSAHMENGLPGNLRSFIHGVGGIESFFRYLYEPTIRDPGSSEAMDLKSYHAQRGSKRMWWPKPLVPQADIMPGDIVLIDIGNDGSSNHIVMCQSYDPSTKKLVTVGGNQYGFVARKPGEAAPEKETADDAAKRKEAEKTTGMALKDHGPSGPTVVGLSVYDLNDQTGKKSTVYGVGRFSLVDYEPHAYPKPG